MARDEDPDFEVEDTESDDDDVDLITYEINYYPADFTLRGYFDKWKDENLVVPPFQRNYVWDQVQASKLVESFLLGLPVPGVFLYKQRGSNKLSIIDGQQRIMSIVRFIQGRFDERVFRLKGVHERWSGKTYDQLAEPDQLQLQDSVLRATVVQQLNPDDDSSMFHVFERLNTGGLKLSTMEIRKCVYFGEFLAALEEWNEEESWRTLIGMPRPQKRLRDIELLLRVLAMRHRFKDYDKPMKGFLNSFMHDNRHADRAWLDAERTSVFVGIDRVLEALGEKPFHLRGRLNLAVMDSVLSMAPLVPEMSPADFRGCFEELVKDDDYLDAVTRNTSDTSFVQRRFAKMRSVFGVG